MILFSSTARSTEHIRYRLKSPTPTMPWCNNRHLRTRPRRRRNNSNNHAILNIIAACVCITFWISANTFAFIVTQPTVSASAIATSQKSVRNDPDGDVDNDGSNAHHKQRQQWIKKHLSPHLLDLFEEDPPSSYRGVKTLADRQYGEMILEIPTQEVILASDFLEGGVDEISDFFHSDTDKEWTEEQIIALGLLSLRKESHDIDRVIYVNRILPQQQHYAVWTLPQDLWDDVRGLLPRCYRESFEATRSHVSNFVQQTTDVQNQKHDSMKSSFRFSKDEILWSFSMVRSRSVAVPELTIQEEGEGGSSPPLAIIPGLDLFNHRFNAGTQLNWIPDDELWAISIASSVGSSSENPVFKKGQEVFLSYGDDKDNWKLLLTYGFALRDNPNQVAFFTWEDLLDSAHRARPTIFTKRTCQQLLKHPQLQRYVAISEDRATFSYDSTKDQPRESLVNGITILSNLAAQLDSGSHDSLPNDVLHDLIRQRCIDLESSMEILRKHKNRKEDVARSVDGTDSLTEWQPFIDSVRLALEEELVTLKALPSVQERSCTAETG